MTIRTGPDLIDIFDDEHGPYCPVCGAAMDWEDCDRCGGDGYDGHDCGEDVCCCLEPEDNEPCEQCDGKGGWWSCYQAPHVKVIPHE
jgi:hypothetical protein